MTEFHYVSILSSLSSPSRYYVGLTANPRKRLHAHNAEQSKHTSKFRPWQMETALAFRSKDKAAAFEKYWA
jgi:predicted GIY-YIG superfamily endonuclease